MSQISVVIPCYNQENYLEECLQSVIDQTYLDWEIILVDDGSTDGSEEIYKKYVKSYPEKVRYIKQQNQGVVIAKNNGIKEAVGPYIFPLDADDKIAPQCLEKLYDVIKEGIFDVIQPNACYFGIKTRKVDLPDPDYYLMYHRNRVINSCLFKKEDWCKYGGYDPKMNRGLEDWEFYSNFIDDGKLFFRVKEPLFFYRRLEKSRNNSMPDKIYNELCSYVRSKHFKNFNINPKGNISLLNKIKINCARLFSSPHSLQKKQHKYTLVKYPEIKNPKIIMTLLVRDEGDILEQNLLFHKAMGVDSFIITDNVSTDNTLKIIEKYRQKGWVTDFIQEKHHDYQQAEWVHRMICLAGKKYKPDWIINADADEFWVSKCGNLKNEISKCTSSFFYVPIYSMLCEDELCFWNNTKKIVRKIPPKKYNKLIADNKLSLYSQFAVSIPKCVHRIQDYKHIRMGNHKVDMVFSTPKVISQDIEIFHYNFRGCKHFVNKMIKGGEDIERNIGLPNAAAHWRYYYGGYKDHSLNLEEEYEKSVGKRCMQEILDCEILEEDDSVKKFGKSEKWVL